MVVEALSDAVASPTVAVGPNAPGPSGFFGGGEVLASPGSRETGRAVRKISGRDGDLASVVSTLLLGP